MTSSLLLLILVTAAIVFATVFNRHPPCLLRRRYGTKLTLSKDDDDHQGSSSCSSQFKNLYLSNLDPEISEEMLFKMFSGFGKMTRLVLAKDFRRESRGFAFMEFESVVSAERAVQHMNGRLIGKTEGIYSLIINWFYELLALNFDNIMNKKDQGRRNLYVERTPKIEEGQEI